MAGGWGSKKNGIRIGAFWDGIQISGDGSQARITDPRVAIDRDVNIVDSSNNLSWSGGAVTDGSDSNLNLDGSGEKRIKNVSGQWQNLDYGSTKTVTFSASLSGVNYAGGTLTVSKSVTFPARAIDPPAAPTGLSATVNATTNTASISWTNNATTSAPYTSLKLERSSNGGTTWVNVPLSGTPTSFSDTGLVANSRYRYRIAAVNSSGTSVYTTMTTDGYTTPNAPSSCTAAKNSSGNIVVSWLDNSAHETGFEVWHSANGGTSWDASPLTTQSAGATSWTHVSPNTGTTHTYRIRAVLGGLVSGYSTQSNTVQLLTKPLAPTLLGPSSGSALNTAISNTFAWRHNSADTTAQTDYELRHANSTDGGTSWSAYTTLVGSTDQFRALPAGTFTPGRLYKWNVRTKGQHADFSDWSADFTFVATTAPTATWVSPTNGGIVDTATVTAQWTYADAESEPQSRYHLTLVDENGNTIETIDTASAATSQAMSTILQNNRMYVLRLQVWDYGGLTSSIVSVTFQTSFPTPRPAVFGDVEWDPNTGSTTISWDNPDPAGEAEQILAVNKAANPSFENTSGTVEVRRNLIQNPRGTGVVAGWALNNQWGGSGGSVSVTTENTPVTLPDGTQVPSFRRKTWTVTPSQGASIAWQFFSTSSNRGAVTAGQTYTVQYAWRKSFAGTVTSNLFQVLFYDAESGGTQVGTFINGPALTNPAPNVWQQDSFTFTVPAGATHCTVTHIYNISDPAILVPGVTFDATAAMVEVSPSAGKYFDGGYSPDPDLTPSWAGPVNASESVLNGVGVANTTGGGGRVAVSSSQWASTGTKSLRVIPLTASNDIPMRVAGADGSLTGLGVTFEAGKTYTAIVKCRLAAPLTGSLHAVRTLRVGVNYGAGSLTSYYGPQAPNTAGVHELRYTFTLPLGSDRCVVVVYGGASAGNGEVWWDDFAIVEGDYQDDYFSGDTVDDPPVVYTWNGTANNSSSTKKIPAIPPSPPSVSNTLLRSEDGGVTWETVATDLENDSTVVDYGPKLDTEILYRIVSVSAMNTVVTSDIESPVDTRNSGQWVFFNVGPAWASWAKVRISPEYDLDFERAKEVHQFAKRDDSVELIGRVRRRTMAFSAVIEPYVEQDAMDALLYIADQEAPIMYRDTRGRKWFVSIGPVKLSTKGLTTFSTQLTYVGRRNVG